MNDQHSPLPPESLRPILIVAVVIALLGGLDWLIASACVAAVVLFLAGWKTARMSAAVRSRVRTVIAE